MVTTTSEFEAIIVINKFCIPGRGPGRPWRYRYLMTRALPVRTFRLKDMHTYSHTDTNTDTPTTFLFAGFLLLFRSIPFYLLLVVGGGGGGGGGAAATALSCAVVWRDLGFCFCFYFCF